MEEIEQNNLLTQQDSVRNEIIIIPMNERMPWYSIKKNEHLYDNLIYVIIFLTLFAFIRIRGQFFMLWTKSIVSIKKTALIISEGMISDSFYYILAASLSFSVISTVISYLFFERINFEITFYIFSILWIWQIISLIIVRLCGWIFNRSKVAKEAIVNIWIFNIMTGIIISPLLFALFFVKQFAVATLIKIIITLVIVLCLMRIIRWCKIFLANKVSIFYMILYLCTLEVFPIMVFYKMLKELL
ncbi:MAG: DUF4271 domain-containing protein [Culturomica sp.]|jgi:hypothetical protein|nr:DUF4271 domain-containing protein [Culturomica sp.]